MGRIIQSGQTRCLQNRTAAVRAVSAVLLLFFSLQLSRFYLVAAPQQDSDAAYCPVPGGESAGHDADHHMAEPTIAPTAGQDGGFYFRHCKDTLDGMLLAPVATLALHAISAQYVPETAPVKSILFEARFSGPSISPLLQPPRLAS
jgi:hypothetical protein